MKSGPLTKPSGSLCDDEQLLWMSLRILEQGERRFLLESNTEVQRKLGHYKAGSCFPHISSSILWISVKRWYLRNALFKGQLTPPVAKDLEKNLQRTSGITRN